MPYYKVLCDPDKIYNVQTLSYPVTDIKPDTQLARPVDGPMLADVVVVGGVLLSVGTALLFWLKLRADPELGVKTATMAEYVFIALLFLVSTSGLLLYGFSGTVFAGFWLIIHLALVATFFLSIPYSKMVHGFFRMASLCREAQLKRYTDRT